MPQTARELFGVLSGLEEMVTNLAVCGQSLDLRIRHRGEILHVVAGLRLKRLPASERFRELWWVVTDDYRSLVVSIPAGEGRIVVLGQGAEQYSAFYPDAMLRTLADHLIVTTYARFSRFDFSKVQSGCTLLGLLNRLAAGELVA